MVIIDQIDACNDGKDRPRELTKIDRVIIHKIGPSLGSTGAEIAKAFRDTSTPYSAGRYTGAEMPYTFVIRQNNGNIIDQCLKLTDVGPHAKRWNTSGIGVALIGDFSLKGEPPTNDQWCSVIELCTVLYGYGLSIHGHTELPGSSSDPAKQCPGPLFDLDMLRSEVHFRAEEMKIQNLLNVGMVI